MGFVLFGTCVNAGTVGQLMEACRNISAPDDRLACYDGINLRATQDLEFSGDRSGQTPFFTVRTGDILTYRNEDAVLVVTVLDESGATVQNLHVGGVGSGHYTVQKPGRVRVQMDASGGWRLSVRSGQGE
ncbi:hypothetical protein [Actibacterium ureilyticum]|uniref:hypothetical protein n=1 Tax=Actibacterium ureilyticum TaxID=1590614 RepID=UPI0015954AFD|nr:hypothetical protein [Actibacterium ureilyticum]